MKKLFVVLLFLLSSTVYADGANLSWDNAEQWTDGTPLAPGDLVETVISYQFFLLGADLNVPRNYIEIDRVSATMTAYFHANIFTGIHCYVVIGVANNGTNARISNESCKTIDLREITPHTNLTVS